MAGIFAFTCECCGERHEGSPSFGCHAPLAYEQLSPAERESHAKLTDDLCMIRHDDGHRDFFVRVCLEIPIHDVEDPFMWGVWASLSEANFKRYTDAWGEHDEADAYFGWFSNRLPHYPDTVNLKTHVHPRSGGVRPWLELEPTDHPLAVHAREGLSIDEAQRIAEEVMHGRKT